MGGLRMSVLPLLALAVSVQLSPSSAFAPTVMPATHAGARGMALCAAGSKQSILGKLSAALLQRLGGKKAGPAQLGKVVRRRRDGIAGARAMFTGIVEELGQVEALAMDIKTPGVTLTVNADTVLEGAYEGCSIAVNGVCLTVTKFDKQQFTVGVAPETLRVTNLGELAVGSPVNLERAAAIDGRNSGHMVQGHVDNVGEIVETWPDKESLFVKIKTPPELIKYIVPKGFIAIDGTSLTVVESNQAESWFTVMLIEYTQKHIVLPDKPVGDKVNLEVDVIGKYVERSLAGLSERVEALEALVAKLQK